MAEANSRRRFRFRLRTLMLLTATVALASWWVIDQLRWIRQRREYIAVQQPNSTARAPWPLWLFREAGADEVLVPFTNDLGFEAEARHWDDGNHTDYSWAEELLSESDRADIDRARRLFPEAKMVRPSFTPSKSNESMLMKWWPNSNID
jgi:hypothetical protein